MNRPSRTIHVVPALAIALAWIALAGIDVGVALAQRNSLPLREMQDFLDSDSKRITPLGLAGADYASLADADEHSLHADHPQCWRLVLIDQVDQRKEHLDEILSLCDRLIDSLLAGRNATDVSDADRAVLVDLLYRRGRAIGYKELPDVVAKYPVKDPERIRVLFEQNFRRLEQLVDTTGPQFILLRIRKERRADNRFEALRLLEVYRSTHPDPRWYPKKRQDILFELGLCAERFPVAKPPAGGLDVQ